jgi:DNA-binding beta-propeller fold protein YncE
LNYNQFLSIVNTSSSVGEVLHLARIELAANTQSRPRRSFFRFAVQAIAPQTLRSAFGFALAASLLTLLAGCGNTYRPVVSAINPVGPAAQPAKYAVVISTPSATAPGLVTFVDFSGDSILITANVGVDPYYLVLNSTGTAGYTLNGDGTLTSFAISTALLSSQIFQTTLLDSNDVLPLSILPQGTFTYVTQPNDNPPAFTTPPLGRNSIAEFTGSPLSLQQELPISPAFSPVYVAGIASGSRSFAISQAINGGPGQVATIENTTTATIDPNPITVGRGPVYGVETADARRVFIMNQTDGTVSVINAQTNALDIVPTGATNPIPVGTSPLWADFAPTRNELVVANAGDGVNPGSLSIISIPLCSTTSQITNPNCDPNNPVDGVGFGTVLATVPTGINTVMTSVLQDGTRAYVANSGNLSLPCALPPAVPGVSTICSVSVVDLTTNTLSQTLYSLPDSECQATTTPTICGHPTYIAATTGSPTGKVYVVSKDSTNMSVIRTDTDSVDTIVPLQGTGVSVRVTAP